MWEVETAYTEVAQENAKEGLTLPLSPKCPNKTVFTHFWADNIHVYVGEQAGRGLVNTTHLVAFQSQCEDAVVNKNLISIERKNFRKLFI